MYFFAQITVVHNNKYSKIGLRSILIEFKLLLVSMDYTTA